MGNSIKAKEFKGTIHNPSIQKTRICEPSIPLSSIGNKGLAANSCEELQQKVAELTAQLHNANKDLDEFTYSISHDLRAPLRAINGYINIIKEDYSESLNAEGLTLLDSVAGNAAQMGELINAILAFSRLGRNVVDITEINMKSLVRSVNLGKMVKNANEVELEIQNLLPAKGQQALIEQVWVSLISNALKFSQHNEKIKIEIGSYAKNNFNVYFIKDNGVGFDMQYYHKLFGVFQRLHTQTEFEGTGISLAIVKKIVSNHNGKVWAESKISQGSCFYFSLPSI
jgi:light-regulated signal transduction histidine kinase (bacteriophytochrome)